MKVYRLEEEMHTNDTCRCYEHLIRELKIIQRYIIECNKSICKLAGYKIKIKNIIFLYTTNKGLFKKIQYIISSNRTPKYINKTY